MSPMVNFRPTNVGTFQGMGVSIANDSQTIRTMTGQGKQMGIAKTALQAVNHKLAKKYVICDTLTSSFPQRKYDEFDIKGSGEFIV